MSIYEHLPQGVDDLKNAGCEVTGCGGNGFALLVYNNGNKYDAEIVCKIHFKDRQNNGSVEEAEEVYTL